MVTRDFKWSHLIARKEVLGNKVVLLVVYGFRCDSCALFDANLSTLKAGDGVEVGGEFGGM